MSLTNGFESISTNITVKFGQVSKPPKTEHDFSLPESPFLHSPVLKVNSSHLRGEIL